MGGFLSSIFMGLIFMGEGALGAIASVFHGGEFFGTGPGDGEQEGRGVYCFHVVANGGAEGEETASVEVVRFAVDGDADVPFENLDGEGAVSVVLFHAGDSLHSDENNSEVVLLEESPRIEAGLPRLLLFGVSYFLGKVELSDFVDHGAVLQRGCHVRALLCRQEVYAS